MTIQITNDVLTQIPQEQQTVRTIAPRGLDALEKYAERQVERHLAGVPLKKEIIKKSAERLQRVSERLYSICEEKPRRDSITQKQIVATKGKRKG